MKLSKELLNRLISITSNSAIACYPFIGKNEKILADKAATDSMRYELNKLDIKGKVVIGEGEMDEAPMLFIGEKLGSGNGPEIDIAVDPVEGTNFVAKNLPGAMTVLAISEKGNLFRAPETYMHKIATAKVEKGLIDLDYSLEKNIKNLSDFKKSIFFLSGAILSRAFVKIESRWFFLKNSLLSFMNFQYNPSTVSHQSAFL